jgi:excisionase family DNA binding protein
MNDSECGFLTLKEMAVYLRLHKVTLWKMIKARKPLPPHTKVGRVYRFFKEGLSEWVDGQSRHSV